MLTPAYAFDRVTIYAGDVFDILPQLPAHSAHTCITSVPYWGLRDYGTGYWEGGDPDCPHKPTQEEIVRRVGLSTLEGTRNNLEASYLTPKKAGYGSLCRKCGARRVDSQIGLEPVLDCLGWATEQPCGDCFVCHIVAVFREVRRVLRKDGSVWLNIGDSYACAPNGRSAAMVKELGTDDRTFRDKPACQYGRGVKIKDMCLQPARLALALQMDGWYVRSDVIWHKPDPIPESVEDRLTKSHEYLFLLAPSPRYYFDAYAIMEACSPNAHSRGPKFHPMKKTAPPGSGVKQNPSFEKAIWGPVSLRNKRSVWTVSTQATPEAHFATYPENLIRPCILASTSAKGCCPHCGAGWIRQTERIREHGQAETAYAKTNTILDEKNGHKRLQRRLKAAREAGEAHDHALIGNRRHVGWKPGCKCVHTEADLVPAVVLDPFMGSGTTGKVARETGRTAIGIELNEDYIQIATRRLSQGSLAMGEV